MEIMTSWKEEGLQQGLQQGLQRETELVLRLLKKRFTSIKKTTERRIRQLPIGKIEELGEALLDFKDANDLQTWLDKASENQQ